MIKQFGFKDGTFSIDGVTAEQACYLLAALSQQGFFAAAASSPRGRDKTPAEAAANARPLALVPSAAPAPETAPGALEGVPTARPTGETETRPAGWDLSGEGSDKDDPPKDKPATGEGTYDLEFIQAQQKFNPILKHLMEHGITSNEALIKVCNELKPTVGVINRIANLEDRIPRAVEAMKTA